MLQRSKTAPSLKALSVALREHIEVPLIVGVESFILKKLIANCKAGADLIVGGWEEDGH